MGARVCGHLPVAEVAGSQDEPDDRVEHQGTTATLDGHASVLGAFGHRAGGDQFEFSLLWLSLVVRRVHDPGLVKMSRLPGNLSTASLPENSNLTGNAHTKLRVKVVSTGWGGVWSA